METKKSEKASLENKRGLFLQTGFIVTLGLTLVAFEWYTPQETITYQGTSDISFEELDPTVITRPEQKKVPPPPKVPIEKIMIVENSDIESLIDINRINFDDFIDKSDLIYLPEPEDETPFIIVQKMPTYKGGDKTAFWKDVNSMLRYPEIARHMGIEGTVHVKFVVSKTGEITNIEIVRSNEPVFSEEVLRVLSKSERWTPGYQRDKAVNVVFNMAFKFKLQD